MKMIGLRNVALATTDEFGRPGKLQFHEGEEVEVPDAFAGTAKAIGYARPIEAVTEGTE